jgi:hypothetical protein
LWQEPLRLWWERQELPVRPLLFWGGGALLLFLLAWLLALQAEGTLVAVAAARLRPWQQARRWLLRLVAIDALVFLPLLLASIAALALLISLLAGTTFVALDSAEPRPILLGGWGLALLCITPLMLLLFPLALLTLLVRRFAFRAAALEELGPRSALRRAWSLIRAAPGGAALSALLLWGLAFTAGPALSALFLALDFVAALPLTAASRSAGWVLLPAILLALVEWPFRAALFAFLGLGWTHAYRQLASETAAP